MGLKNDVCLSGALSMHRPVTSKTRTGKLPVGTSLLLRVLDLEIMELRELRELRELSMYVPRQD